jgi:hypothetical protein
VELDVADIRILADHIGPGSRDLAPGVSRTTAPADRLLR